GHIVTFTDYTYYDDYILIARNFSHIDELSDIPRELFEDAGHQGQGGNLYRPILTITFILSAQLSGLSLWGYHLTNIFLHALACMLLFKTLSVLAFRRVPAFVATLLFCVHPALTQAVGWISGRNDPLLAVFLLPALIAYVRFSETEKPGWYFLGLVFFWLSILTKETAIAFPFLALLYSAAVRRERLFSRKTLLWIIGWGVIIVNWQLMRYVAQMAPLGDLRHALGTILSHWSVGIAFFGKILWPFDLAFAPMEEDLGLLPGIVTIIVTLALFFFSRTRNWGMLLFGAVWFGMLLAPTFFHHDNLYYPPKFYEHRIYVPLIGALFVFLTIDLSHRIRPKKWTTPLALLFTVILLATMSVFHSFHFRDSISLRQYAARSSPQDETQYSRIDRMHLSPKVRAHISALRGDGQTAATLNPGELRHIVGQFEDDVEGLHPQAPDDHTRAILLFGRGFLTRSVNAFRSAISREPLKAEIRYNLGVLYYDAHKSVAARDEWVAALELDSLLSEAHHNLAYLYHEQGENNAALEHCRKAIELGAHVPPDLLNAIRVGLESPPPADK
ncbi:MAG: tetratricopeptide repeat protein, partial [Bacteroidota bacterium]